MLGSGNIIKMRSEFANPVQYFLPIGETELPMNNLIGKSISLKFTGQINCISCGKRTKTSFGQGFGSCGRIEKRLQSPELQDVQCLFDAKKSPPN